MYRILIVDDESSIREGVARYLTKNCPDYVVGTAENGSEALQIAQTLLPDVIITDITMPRLNGLDFLEHIKHMLPDTQMIILSGYDKFEYAQQALSLGVREYLIKPLDTKKLCQILAQMKLELDKAKQSWNQMQKAKQLKPSGEELHLKQEYRNMLLQKKDIEFSEAAQRNWVCVVCRGYGDLHILEEAVKQKFETQMQTCCLLIDEECVIVLSYQEENIKGSFLKINIGLTSIANYFRTENLGIPYFFLGSFVSSGRELALSMKQAQKAAQYSFLDEIPPVFNYEDSLADQFQTCFFISEDMQRKLILEVQYGDKETFAAVTEELFACFVKYSVKDAVFIRSTVVSLCYRLLSGGQDSVASLNYLECNRFFASIAQVLYLADLKQQFIEFITFLRSKRKGNEEKNTVISNEVERITKANISNPYFSLDDIADLLYISPNYLRQLFKQETGTTFVEYLTAVRMKQAERLLRNGRLKISDVAEQVGYKDPRYFSSCFKKRYHISPSEYPVSS
jgi:Response regulator containing CheY-like receiver domain and AraC-type DNA-binding domain